MSPAVCSQKKKKNLANGFIRDQFTQTAVTQQSRNAETTAWVVEQTTWKKADAIFCIFPRGYTTHFNEGDTASVRNYDTEAATTTGLVILFCTLRREVRAAPGLSKRLVANDRKVFLNFQFFAVLTHRACLHRTQPVWYLFCLGI